MMSDSRQRSAAWWCRLTLRSLAASFATVGALFFLFPDGTIRFMNVVGSVFGDFTPAPASALRFWLSLATGYMVLVTTLALQAQRDLQRHRDLLLLLALGKATSSLTCWVFYRYSLDAFIYLANFLVDGSIAVTAVTIWAMVPSLRLPVRSAATMPAVSPGPRQPIFSALLEAMLPPGGPYADGGLDLVRSADIDSFMGGRSAARPLHLGLRVLDLCPFLVPPRLGQRFSQLPLEDRIRVLQAWEGSRIVPLRQFVHTLKLLIMPQFYSRPEIEAHLGYPHPLVRVPRAEGMERRDQ